jgi:polysaccharide biosynthesis/export protein
MKSPQSTYTRRATPLRCVGVLVAGWLAMTFFVAGCSSLSGKGPEIEMEEISFSFDGAEKPTNRFEQYLLSPGDLLDVLYHVKAWEGQTEFRLEVDHQVEVKFPDLPELNELTTIRPDGNISLPYLGEVKAAGMTVAELTTLLKERYATILRAPELFVTVPDFRQAIREFKADLHTTTRGQSRLVTVRPDGQATFAMIGDVMVSGRTIRDVRDEMNERYAVILPGLSTDLFLERHSGSRIYVLGQVNQPGSYEIQRPTTVMEALALAGSHLRSAKLGSVVVIRRQGDKMVGTRVDARSSLRLKRDSFFFHLRPDDVVYVPKTTISKIGDVAEDVQRILFFNGWGFNLEFNPFGSQSPVSTTTTRTSTTSGGSTTPSTTTSTETSDTQYERR